jgi:transposase
MPSGRPTKLTPDLQRQVCDALRRGAYVETAAAMAGVSKVTLYGWLKLGAREEEGPHVEFLNAVEKAQAEAEMRDLDRVDAAAEGGTWQAAAWRLERRSAERWGRPGMRVAKPVLETASEDDCPTGLIRVELVRCPTCGEDQLPGKKLCGDCGGLLKAEAA